jgi:hypothetical protein
VNASTSSWGPNDAHSLGFHTQALPIMSAPTQLATISTGKFHGEMNPATPIGW